MWSLPVLSMSRWVSSECSSFPHHQNMCIGLSPVSTLDPVWLRIWSWSLGTTLWLPTAPQGWVKCRDHISLYTVYVTNKVPLPLSSPQLGTFTRPAVRARPQTSSVTQHTLLPPLTINSLWQVIQDNSGMHYKTEERPLPQAVKLMNVA